MPIHADFAKPFIVVLLLSHRGRAPRVYRTGGGVRRASVISPSAHKAQVGAGEAAEVGEDERQVARRHSEPAGEGGRVLVDRGGGDPPPVAGIVGTTDGEGRQMAVDPAAAYGAAEHEVVAP